MKRLLIWSAVALLALSAGIGLAGEKEGGGRGGHKKGAWGARALNDPNAPAVADANRPAHPRRMAQIWKRAFRTRIKRLEEIREIAAEEGATKTVAALDKMIAEEKERLQKMKQRIRRWRAKEAGEAGREKGERAGRTRGRHKHRDEGPGPEDDG